MCFNFNCNSHQVYTVGPSGTSLLMWATTGNHGNQWTYANVILSNPAPFRVTFQAEVGGDMLTDIALDDISYTAECVAEGKSLFFLFVSFCSSILFLFSSPVLSAPRSFFMPFPPIFTFSPFPLFPHLSPAMLLCSSVSI